MKLKTALILMLPSLLSVIVPALGTAQTLQHFCYVRGMEERQIHGIGIVTGLNGTGDSEYGGNIKALAAMLRKNRFPMPVDLAGVVLDKELKEAKNCALVSVTATIPATGARVGSKIDVNVDTLHSATSLEGGTLYLTVMNDSEPDSVQDPFVSAWSYGKIQVDTVSATTGTIKRGARINRDMERKFVFADANGERWIEFIIDPSKASFALAYEIASGINDHSALRAFAQGADEEDLARPVDAGAVRVLIPKKIEAGNEGEEEDLVYLIGSLMTGVQLVEVATKPRVTINEKAGTIVIGRDVKIAGVAIATAAFSVENTGGGFVPLQVEARSNADSLQDLIKALDALKAPMSEKIAIIKEIDSLGYLYGELLVK